MSAEDLIEMLNSLPSDSIISGSITITYPGRTNITIALRDPAIVLEEAIEPTNSGKAG